MTEQDRVVEAKLAVLAALEALARAELAAADPGSWRRVQKIATIGTSIQSLYAARTAEVAATVAQPARGCPLPEFVKAEIRARQVLDVFLTPEQQADFRSQQRFVSIGASGRRYMISSRQALCGKFIRSLYDLTNDFPICTHDYTVPAAEEVLALHLMVSLPGQEDYARGLRA